MAGGHRQRGRNQRQRARRLRPEWPRNQHDGRTRRRQQQRDMAHALHPLYAIELRDVCGQRSAEGGRVAVARAGALHVQRRGQYRVQPVNHRAAKAADHHRQRHRQAQAGYHAADGHSCGATRAPRPLQSQQRQQALLHQRLQHAQQQCHAPRQYRNAADQAQRNRHISRNRNTKYRWNPYQSCASSYQNQTPAAGRGARIAQAQTFEGLRCWQRLRRPRRPPAAQQRRAGAQCAINHSGRGAELQRRLRARKVAPSQVTA